MGVLDLVGRVVAGPAGRVVEAPVRDMIDEALRQSNIASPQELQAVRVEVSRVTAELHELKNQLVVLADAVKALQHSDTPAPQVDTADILRQATAAATQAVAAVAADLATVTDRVGAVEARPAQVAVAASSTAAGPTEASERRQLFTGDLKETPKAAPKQKKAAAPAEAKKAAAPAKARKAAAPAKAKKAAAPAKSSRRGRKSLAHLGCSVEGCQKDHRSKGFCGSHYQTWRRGKLEGFVNLGGVVPHEGGAFQVDAKYAGQAVKVTGRGKRQRVRMGKEILAFERI